MTSYQPSKGRIVILALPEPSNGDDTCPAIITRVWSDSMINVTAFPDNADPRPYTSVTLVAPGEDAPAGARVYAEWPQRQ